MFNRVFTPHCWSVMNDSTPLLGQVTGHIPPTELDLFMQVVESPWAFITGRSLFLIRTFLAITMTSILALHLTIEILSGNGAIFAFRLMNLAWGGQCIYMWLTSYWTYLSALTNAVWQNPYAPSCHHYTETLRSLLGSCLLRTTSFPSERNVCVFSTFHTFYTVTMVIPFAATLQFFTTQSPKPPLELVLNTANILVSLAELGLLNSVAGSSSCRDQQKLLVQTLNLALLAAAYAKVWVWIGNDIVNGPESELDSRLYVGGWRAVNVVTILYVGWWMLEQAKGRMMERWKGRAREEEEGV